MRAAPVTLPGDVAMVGGRPLSKEVARKPLVVVVVRGESETAHRAPASGSRPLAAFARPWKGCAGSAQAPELLKAPAE
jgi:hypothetical protein